MPTDGPCELPCLYHATPLHYLPHIVQSGALYPKSVLAASGIHPRASAARRDRMLGLADWIHLSLRPDTPLLRDKMGRGYPHALLVFAREPVLALPQVALLPFNTKAWRSRADLQPVTGEPDKAALLRRHRETGRPPSLEVLVRYGLGFEFLTRVVFLTDDERAQVADLLGALALAPPAPLAVAPSLFPRADYRPTTGEPLAAYFARCRAAGSLLPPPDIPFD